MSQLLVQKEGRLALRVELPAGFLSTLGFVTYLLGGGMTEDEVAQQALKRAMEAR